MVRQDHVATCADWGRSPAEGECTRSPAGGTLAVEDFIRASRCFPGGADREQCYRGPVWCRDGTFRFTFRFEA